MSYYLQKSPSWCKESRKTGHFQKESGACVAATCLGNKFSSFFSRPSLKATKLTFMHGDERINVSRLIQNLQKGSNPKEFVINSGWDERVGVNKWVSLFRTVFTSHKMTSRQTHKCVAFHADFINGAKSQIICQCFTSCRVPPDSTRHPNRLFLKGVWQLGHCWDE